MTTVIAGCGDLGGAAGRALVARGHRVLGLRRSPEKLPAGIEGQAVDLSRNRPTLPPDTGTVIVALTADARTERAYHDTYLVGLSHVLDAVESQLPDPPRLLLVSSTAVYGTDDGSWVDEHTPALPATDTGKVLLETERELHHRAPSGIVLRLAGLYGPGRGRLLARVRDGRATLPSVPSFTNRIHRDDAAHAIVHLATRPEAPQPTYLGVDHEPTDRADLLRFLADELGVSRPRAADTHSNSSRGKRCRNDRLLDSGFAFRYPTYREGYGAIVAHKRETAMGTRETGDESTG